MNRGPKTLDVVVRHSINVLVTNVFQILPVSRFDLGLD